MYKYELSGINDRQSYDNSILYVEITLKECVRFLRVLVETVQSTCTIQSVLIRKSVPFLFFSIFIFFVNKLKD